MSSSAVYKLYEYRVLSALNNPDSIDEWDQSDSDVTSFQFREDRVFGEGSARYTHAANTNVGDVILRFNPALDLSSYEYLFAYYRSSSTISHSGNEGIGLYDGTNTDWWHPDIASGYTDRWLKLKGDLTSPDADNAADLSSIDALYISNNNNGSVLDFGFIAVGTEVFHFGNTSDGNPPPTGLGRTKRSNIMTHSILGGPGGYSQSIGSESATYSVRGMFFGDLGSTANVLDKHYLQEKLDQLVFNERPYLFEWDQRFYPIMITNYPSISEGKGDPLIFNFDLQFIEFNNDR